MWSSLPSALGLVFAAQIDPLLAAAPGPAPQSSTAAPYSAWSGSRHAPPRGAVDPGPAPLPDEPELSRRSFELVPELGAAFAQCGGRQREACGAAGASTALGLSALYRASPWFAFGASARAQASSFGASSDAHGRSIFAGVAARVYFFESGLWDPYVELALGLASLEASHASARQRLRESAGFAPAARVAAGLDFGLSPWLRAGPVLSMERSAPERVERCAGASCTSIAAADSAVPRGFTSFGLRLTFGAGEAQ